MELAQVQFAIRFDSNDAWEVTGFDRAASHPLLKELRERDAPGLVLFSSGSTGESKGSVLDFNRLLTKFETSRPSHRMLVFLLLDHIGGINTLLHGLCHGGTIVTARERSPDAVCMAIEEHRVEVLPTTPTFLRLLLIADAVGRYDLSSLKVITYGTEPMPPSTLAAIREALPWVQFKQTYGLSEVGILPTRSPNSGSVWLKLGDTGFEHKIVNGVLWIRSPSAMLGYLNASSRLMRTAGSTPRIVEKDGEYVVFSAAIGTDQRRRRKVHQPRSRTFCYSSTTLRTPCAVGQIDYRRDRRGKSPLVQEDFDALKQRVPRILQRGLSVTRFLPSSK
jgi:acyl-coenzyme A synthetase/AMP-(fatty) acid ligase